MNPGKLYLHNKGRRAGLSRGGYQGPRLLRSLNASTQSSPGKREASTMASAGKNKELDEEDITRAPESSSDEEISADIRPTNFRRASEEVKPQPLPEMGTRGRKVAKQSINKGTRNSARKDASTPNGSESPKRKNLHDIKLGSGMSDVYGRVTSSQSNKRRKALTAYGKSSQPTASAKTLSQSRKLDRIDDSEEKLPKTFKAYSPIGDSPQNSQENGVSTPLSPRKSFMMPGVVPGTPSTTGSPATANKSFNIPEPFSSSPSKDSSHVSSFQKVDFPDDDSPSTDPPEKAYKPPKPRNGQKVSILVSKAKIKAKKPPPLTQLPAFQHFGLDDELLGKASEILNSSQADRPRPPIQHFSDDEDDLTFATMTQRSICPMCRQPVDADSLRAQGNMNLRQQEAFCRAHRKKTAQEEWEDSGYPEIDWSHLSSRVQKHHDFLERLINGESSHYRDKLGEKVDAGQDRNLLKTNSDLTPGYYGPRGLRLISESIMSVFTRLLKARIIHDKLMSARGFTPYVQLVLVPEVTTLLICDDMNVDIEKSREIFEDSKAVGELLNEEERDVVRRRRSVGDSEDEDELS